MHAPDEHDPIECFYANTQTYRSWPVEHLQRINALRVANLLVMVPVDKDGFYIFSTNNSNGPIPTVTMSHIRLPKLSHLITLVPSDFFLLMRLIATAKNTPSGDSLSLNLGSCGIQSLDYTPLSPFFMKLRTNYRMNPDYCDRKWTPRDAIKFLSKFEPTIENQLAAMQYLTVLQNEDILYFPLDSMVNLELEWEQVDDDYCIPPENLTKHMPEMI